MDHDILKKLPKNLVDRARMIMESTKPVETKHVEALDEKLIGNQHKIDANGNGKIDAEDFKLLRRKKAVKEALESGVEVEDLIQFNSPMQPELHEEVGVVVHRDRRDNTIHVVVEGMKYKLKKGQVKEVSEELLGELSKKTLASYVDKAAIDVHNQAYNAGKKEGQGRGYDTKRLLKGISRQVGISKAAKKLAQEEVEELEELSNRKLAAYANKANKQGVKIARSGVSQAPGFEDQARKLRNRQDGEDMARTKLAMRGALRNEEVESVDEMNYRDSGAQNMLKASMKADRIAAKDREAREKAKKTNEEVEQIDEVSKETMLGYKKGAEAQIAATKKPGKPSKAAIALRVKRGAGLEKVKSKLQDIYRKESEARQAERQKINNSLDAHFDKNHHAVLEKHGFKLMSQGETPEHEVKTYIHPHKNGHATMISIQKKKGSDSMYGGYRHEVRAVNTKGTSYSSHHPNTGFNIDAEEQKTQMMPKFEAHVINVKNEGALDSRY